MKLIDIKTFLSETAHSVNLNDIINSLHSANSTCLFVKNEYSSYVYGNANYIRLLGVGNLNCLLKHSDEELSGSKKEAKKFKDLDRFVIEEEKQLAVKEKLDFKFSNIVKKEMQGSLYPLHHKQSKANYVLGLVTPSNELLFLDWDSVFRLTSLELKLLLSKVKYNIQVGSRNTSLTRMEVVTIAGVVKGMQANQIADSIQLQNSTIESYLVNIKTKFGVSSRSDLINLVIKENVLKQIVV